MFYDRSTVKLFAASTSSMYAGGMAGTVAYPIGQLMQLGMLQLQHFLLFR